MSATATTEAPVSPSPGRGRSSGLQRQRLLPVFAAALRPVVAEVLLPVVGAALLIGLSAGCGGASDPSVAAPPSSLAGGGFVFEDTAFDAPPPTAQVPFDVVAADMELDGDPDLLVNWHNLAPLELFENVGGRFTLVNREGADSSGLFDNPGIPSVYAPLESMLERLRESSDLGVFVWHDPNRRGDWHFYVLPDADPVAIRIAGNRPIALSIDDRLVTRVDEHDADLEIDVATHFSVTVASTPPRFVATRLEVRASLPLHVGSDQRAVGDSIELWKDDPHGMAWVDVGGTAPPDLFITRGGLMGTLLPPQDPKADRFFVYGGGSADGESGGEPAGRPAVDTVYEDRRSLIPSNYGRGRRVEWVDIDGDGRNELYIGNTDSANTLLAADAAGAGTGADVYRDIAPATGLDAIDGDTFAWMDVDDSGLDDLVFVGASGFEVAVNRGSRTFEMLDGDELGLVFPAGSEPDTDALFANLSLHVLDFDNDGRLDLWLVGHGEGRAHALYRGAEGGFIEVTAAAGLHEAPGANSMIVLDIDNDGFLDAITPGLQFVRLHNDAGQGFAIEALDGPWSLPAYTRSVAIDADGDGRLDLALIGERRLLARNATDGGTALDVTLRAETGDPVGAVVRAFYANGMVQAQRYGSAASTQYSQGALPLHFGVPAGTPIEALEVRWPGGISMTRSVGVGETAVELRR